MNLLRLWHTLRWLKPVQWYGRAWFRLWRPRPDLAPAPPWRAMTGHWVACARAARLLSPTRMRFLHVERELAHASDWNRADWPKLWLYNAHYFDDLVADHAADRADWHRTLISRWVKENPPASGTGWEPYPLSLRIVNWIKWSACGNALDASTRHSLAIQVRQLRQRLEFHLLGNHLWANAKALVFAGVAHDGDEATTWLAKGLSLIERELGEQILADGGHFERSPMYHAIVLEDVLDLVQLARCLPGTIPAHDVTTWCATAARMLRSLQVMSHPDGDPALFNDCAPGIAPTHAALADYARRLGVLQAGPAMALLDALPDTGYVRLATGPALLIADVGKIGPDYLPGHAHADTLSFELSLHGRRLLVNAGTSTYAAGPLRLWQRGSAAKNTVVVDDENSSEVWSSFRIARRALPFDVGWDADALTIHAAHDGYRRLPGKVVHRRLWAMTATGLRVTDHLEGRFDNAVARYRFAPGVDVAVDGTDHGIVRASGRTLAWRASGARQVRVVAESWYPGFGREQPCSVLVLVMDNGALEFELQWGA